MCQALDPVTFAQKSLRFEPDELQAQALRSGRKKIIFNTTRQWGKTTVAAIRSLHRAVFYPRSVILIVSYIKDQAAELYRKIETFQSIMEDRVPDIEHSKQSMVFLNKSRILIVSAKEQVVRGYSPDLVVIDEASRVPDEVYFSIRPSLSVSGGSLMLISTPRGKRGFFFHEWTKGKEFEKYEVSGWECPRISDEFLESERAKVGPLWFGQEYENSFVSIENYMFDPDLFRASISSEIESIHRSSVISHDVETIKYQRVIK